MCPVQSVLLVSPGLFCLGAALKTPLNPIYVLSFCSPQTGWQPRSSSLLILMFGLPGKLPGFLAVARVSLNLSFGGIGSKSANLVGRNNNNVGILEFLRLEKTFN